MRYLLDAHVFLGLVSDDPAAVAKAMHEGMHLVSRDVQLDAYAVTRIWS